MYTATYVKLYNLYKYYLPKLNALYEYNQLQSTPPVCNEKYIVVPGAQTLLMFTIINHYGFSMEWNHSEMPYIHVS